MENPIDEQREQNPKNPPVMEIEIVRHRALFNLLSDSRSLWRLMISLFMLIVVLFLGLAFVVFSIKKIYPYNAIETNIYGATTMESEDKDVTYWLFNTAELWANSGIKVETGDVLTIRTSGAWHTAIHHLVKATEENSKPSDFWVSSQGADPQAENVRGVFRTNFRVAKGNTDGILLMNIIPEEAAKVSTVLEGEGKNEMFMKFIQETSPEQQSMYVVGKERTNLVARSQGVLHFAVNDIVLTRTAIKELYKVFVDSLSVRHAPQAGRKAVCDWLDRTEFTEDDMKELARLWGEKNIPNFEQFEKERPCYYMGFYNESNPAVGCLDNELVYYYRNSFVDAWYLDNLGSILIVVERHRKNSR